MPIKVTMPALSPTMEEGTLAKWHVKEGDTVEAGDIIAEIETDKATMEVEAVDEGTVGKIVVAEGTENVKVNAVIAVLLEEGEDESALDDMDLGSGGGEKTEEKEEKEEKAETEETKGTKPSAQDSKKAKELSEKKEKPSVKDEGGKAPPAPRDDSGERVFSSPLARRMAKQAGLDLTSLDGSGPHGRIVKADIERALEKGEGKKKPSAAPSFAATAGRQGPTEVSLNNIQKVIAERLTEADRDVPQFYLSVDMEIDRLLAARKEINDAADGAYKVSVNDMIIKACAAALRREPDVNAQWGGDKILRMNTVDIAVAVATDKGLITPIVFDADRKGIAQISEDMKDLAERAKDGKLKPEEYQGGGFSISNLGMFGTKQFTSIINPPAACILAVGAGEERPVVKNGELTVATVMTATLTCDHRVVDGALGARFMAVLKTIIEAPATMLA